MKKIWFVWFVFAALLPQDGAAAGLAVVDGDSLEYGRERIRLLGIDAPEFLQKCYDGSGWKYRCGFEAAEHLRKLVKNTARCTRLGKERYGRSLAKCYTADGQDIGRQMVLDGMAVATEKEYFAAERDAKSRRKGIWRGKFMRPELYRALKKASANEKR